MDHADEIRKAVKLLFQPGDTIEVRAFNQHGSRQVGRYPLGWELVRAIEAENDLDYDVYYVLNPTSLSPTLIDSNNSGTKETDVPRRRWFLLDFDPIRKHKIATDEQFAAALAIAEKVRALIQEELKEEPIAASSGNGVHLLVPVDLPNDEPSKAIIKLFQKSISQKFSTPEVEIECFPDAARLVRAYGTLNRKGQETDQLRWRRSHIL